MLHLKVGVVIQEGFMAGLNRVEGLLVGLVAEAESLLVKALHGRETALLVLEGLLHLGGIEAADAQFLPVPLDVVEEESLVTLEALDMALHLTLLLAVLARLIDLLLAVAGQNDGIIDVAGEQCVELLLEGGGSRLL
ncbi:hypothetical protein PG988_007497 [Apiospora saccharicola]